MSIRREDLTPELMARIAAQMRESGMFEPLAPEERERSLQEILASVRPGEDVWVFGYGSLVWNPLIRFAEKRVALVRGYHRRYCFWVRLGRGSPEEPGLMLGLDRGGSCKGVGFRVPAADVEAELRLVWMREMLSGVYRPRWMAAQTAGGPIRAVAFVVNRAHPLYCGTVSLETAARHLARARGRLGSCREYLENTVAHLAELGVRDSYLTRIHRLVQAIPEPPEAGERTGGPA
jgi:cation transport protein ChaC